MTTVFQKDETVNQQTFERQRPRLVEVPMQMSSKGKLRHHWCLFFLSSHVTSLGLMSFEHNHQLLWC